MKTTPSRGQRRPAAWWVAPVAILLLAVAGCTDDEATGPDITVDPEVALTAAATASHMQQIADAEHMLDAIQAPLSSAAGNFEDLGNVTGGSTELGDYWSNSKMLASGAQALDRFALDPAALALRQAWTQRPDLRGKVETCDTQENVTVCFEELGGDVVRVRITEVFGPLHLLSSVEQVFEVDTNGTPEDGDDRIANFSSTVNHRNGLVIRSSVTPVAPAGFVEDDVQVTLVEVVEPAFGLVDRQTNTITMDVKDVETDGDEVIWSLSSVVEYFDGAQSAMAVDETPLEGEPNGLTDEDRVTLTVTFTAAPTNARLESITAEIVILPGILADEGDDRFEQVSRTIVFDGATQTGGQPTATVQYTPSEPVAAGQEPCAGTFSRQATFPAGWETQSLTQNVTHDCESGGSATMIVSYLDDTTYTRTISWSGSGTATLSAAHRDGTTVVGTFDENTHGFDVTTTFPEGHDPVTVRQTGSSNPELGSRSYTIVTTHADDSIRSLSVTGTDNDDGTRDLVGTIVDGAGTVDFAMNWNPHLATLTGSADGPQEQALDYTLVGQEDGGALLDFVYVDPAQDLTVSGDMVIYPDGSGCGTLTIEQGEASATFPVCFDAEGRGSIQPATASVIRW